MAMPAPSPKSQRMRQSRKSLGHVPVYDEGFDKENATVDIAALTSKTTSLGKKNGAKSRSKSLGPGGLDALREGTGNRGNLELTQLKSILKPKIVRSPERNHARSPSRSLSPSKQHVPASPSKKASVSPQKQAKADDNTLSNIPMPKIAAKSASPMRSPTRVALRTEEEQQAAARERERQEKLEQKEARRKSLANRRVSFAPEATLHTWNVIEMPEDSTTSSASTNSSRRASGFNFGPGSPYGKSYTRASDGSDPPSTPPEQVEDQVMASPSHQRDLHQKKRRRSSTVPAMRFSDADAMSSSPMSTASDDDTTQGFETAYEDSGSSDSDDHDLVEEDTVTNVDADNTFHSVDSTASSGRLDAALREAAQQAGTRGIEYDEYGDMTMDMADDEVTNAFQPWARSGHDGKKQPVVDTGDDNIASFPSKEAAEGEIDAEGETVTMEMTQAIGQILPTDEQTQNEHRRRKSLAAPMSRRASVARRQSIPGEDGGEATMDLTTAIGSIRDAGKQAVEAPAEEDGEMTMDFTAALGGVLPAEATQKTGRRTSIRRQSVAFSDDGTEMDLTQAVGGILPPTIMEHTEPVDDQTAEMDMTIAGGAILPSTQREMTATTDRDMAANESFTPEPRPLQRSPFHRSPATTINGAGLLDERPLPALVKKAFMATETGSPAIATPRTGPRNGLTSERSPSRASFRPPSPTKKIATPTKQLTPKPNRPTTPGKTPPSKNVTMRSASPKKLFQNEISSAKKSRGTTPLTPNKQILIPYDPRELSKRLSFDMSKRRRSSGVGIDRDDLGSPHVSALLDRRRSIGEGAKAFVTKSAGGAVRFEDPRAMEKEIDQDRAEDARKESGRDILEEEVDSQGVADTTVTSSLKDKIQSMTPQKKKLNGRKSLHVGAARGLLGKRPAELDDEDDEEDSINKRLKSNKATPVKAVKLPAPPTKAETTGKAAKSARKSLAEASVNTKQGTPSLSMSPSKQNTTPKEQGRFRDAEDGENTKVTPFKTKVDGEEAEDEYATADDRLHLQEFLNLTGIRFMELTTTKRRQTVAPNADFSARKAGVEHDATEVGGETLEDFVVAGACTVPMLELYQHSCRELRNYISEGRKVAKEIEDATYEDNPPLFREYLLAPVDVKPIMDNQFRNVKANARLLSRALWYEWRMKLLDGLKDGLHSIANGFDEDEKSLTLQEQALEPILPVLLEQHRKIQQAVHMARNQAEELASCDKEELKTTRQQLSNLDSEIAEKRREIEQVQSGLKDCEDRLEQTLNQKDAWHTDVKEAEKLRDECRGWSFEDVARIQIRIQDLEAQHGWSIESVDEPSVTMSYRRTLQLLFCPSAFRPNNHDGEAETQENAPIRLIYTADSREVNPEPLTTEKRFFLQIIRAQLQGMEQSESTPKQLLKFVSGSWSHALSVAEQIRTLDISYITEPIILADETMAIRSTMLLKGMKTKVEATVAVNVQPRHRQGAMSLAVTALPTAKVCYGEGLNEKKMSEFLAARVKGCFEHGAWADAMQELEGKLIARGRKT